jgi:Domain of unknown function (DUF1858)
MRVHEVLRRHPLTAEVFILHGCPNMRRGFFAVMARVMKVRWAARMHGIPCDGLVADLNAAVVGPDAPSPSAAKPP